MRRWIFVGIDMGNKGCVARIGLDVGKSERFGFTNTQQGRARLFREVEKRAAEAGATILMAYEASSCGFVLHDEAERRGIPCRVLAPTKMQKSAEQRKNKNDDRDADDILERLRAHALAGNRLPTVWIPDVATRDDRELVRARLELTEKQTKLKTQIQMLIKRNGLEKPGGLGAGWTVRYRAWLKGLREGNQLGWGTRQALATLLEQLTFIEGEIERVEKPVEQLAQDPRHLKIVTELCKEKGVGLLTSLAYRTEIGNAGRFRRARQAGKFVGLTPTSNESGEINDRKGHISRQGPARLRKLLCQASLAHIRHDGEVAHVYYRLVARNPKKKKIAIVAVMRQLTVRLLHRMRKAELEMTKSV